MKGLFKNIICWWEPKDKLFSSYLLPLLCLALSFIYQDQFLNDTCTETVKKHLILFRPHLFQALSFFVFITVTLSFLSSKFGDNTSAYKLKLNDFESKIDLLQNNTRELFDGLLLKVLPGFPWVTPVRNWPGRGLDRHRRSRWLS